MQARLQEQYEADRELDHKRGKKKFTINLNFEECAQMQEHSPVFKMVQFANTILLWLGKRVRNFRVMPRVRSRPAVVSTIGI
eukprot:191876-Hanusia_phi.AAC.1